MNAGADLLRHLSENEELRFPFDDSERVRQFLFAMEYYALRVRHRLLTVRLRVGMVKTAIFVVLLIIGALAFGLYGGFVWRLAFAVTGMAAAFQMFEVASTAVLLTKTQRELRGFRYLWGNTASPKPAAPIERSIQFPWDIV